MLEMRLKNQVENGFHEFILNNGKRIIDPNERGLILSSKKTAVNWICDEFQFSKDIFYSIYDKKLIGYYNMLLLRESLISESKFIAMKYAFRWFFMFKGISIDPIRGFGKPIYGAIKRPPHRINHDQTVTKVVPEKQRIEDAPSNKGELILLANLKLFRDGHGDVYIKLSSA